MRNWITFLMTFSVGISSYVNAAMGDVNVFAGYRHDKIHTEFSVPKNDPVFKQSTKAKDLNIFEIGVNFRTALGGGMTDYNTPCGNNGCSSFCNAFYLRGEAVWGWILDGELERKIGAKETFYDYNSYYGFDTFNEMTHRNTVDDKYVYDANIAIGYPFYFCDCSAVLAPVIGYAVDAQNVSSYDRGFDLRSNDCGSYLGEGSNCCKHSVLYRWYGPFVGVDLNYRPYQGCWNLYAAFEYHWGTAKVKGDRYYDNDNHFHRHADMDGWVVDLGVDYEMNQCWTLGLYLKFTDFSASKHHRLFGGGSDYNSGSGTNKGKHHADWRSYAVNLEIGKQF